MNYQDLKLLCRSASNRSYGDAAMMLQEEIFSLNKEELVEVIAEIGVIPEDIDHDSKEEKIYTKVSDILFAKSLSEMGLQTEVLRERSDSADIVAKSKFYGYSLVGDAKAFRLSRTAKNAKDFKVESMWYWRGVNDFSVLACPYFQYPKKNSQVFKEALNRNVCLFSWEYLYIMLKANVCETESFSLRDVWDQSNIIGSTTTIGNAKSSFLEMQSENIRKIIGVEYDDFYYLFNETRQKVISRGNMEIDHCKAEIERIKGLDRESAVNQLLETLNIESRIETIQKTIDQMI